MKKNSVFVLMPFGGIDEEVYEGYIKPTVENQGFTCRRASEEAPNPRSIQGEIIQSIVESDLILTELTGQNANVYYELALAHVLNKPTIMYCRGVEELPFDLLTYRVVLYENTAKGLRYLENNLAAMLIAFKRGIMLYSNPVQDHLKESPYGSVYSTNQVLDFEAAAKDRICVIAPDIALGPSNFRSIMRTNLLRGIHYQYLLAGEDSVINDFHSFVESLELGEREKFFSGRRINPDYVESDVTLIDPATPGEIGFILAPAEIPSFHYRVVGGSLHRLKARFNRLWLLGEETI